jgi:hypothetical protein
LFTFFEIVSTDLLQDRAKGNLEFRKKKWFYWCYMIRLQTAVIVRETQVLKDMYSELYRVSNKNGKMFVHVSVIP